MSSKSIAHEAKGRMGYWLDYCFSKIQLVGQKYRDKTTLLAKRDAAAIVLVFMPALFASSGL